MDRQYLHLWKLVDLQTWEGELAKEVFQHASPTFSEKADPYFLDCLRSAKRYAVEFKVMKMQFTNVVKGKLDEEKVMEYQRIMSGKCGTREFPAAVQVIKMFQLKLYCEKKTRTGEGAQRMPLEEWKKILLKAAGDAAPADPVLTDPDASKTLTLLLPNLMTKAIEGLEPIIEKLMKVSSCYFTNNFRTLSYMLRSLNWTEVGFYDHAIRDVLRGPNRPEFIEILLSVQYVLCIEELEKEGEAVTPNLGLRFLYKDYY